jgi:ankyrin repeat protein
MGLDEELFFAVQICDIDKVRELLGKGANPNVKQGSLSALHMVAMADESICAGILELLLEYGANPNVRDSVGATPLHDAVLSGKVNAVKKLLEHGADVNVRTTGAIVVMEDYAGIFTESTYSGVTPLHLAAYKGYAEIAKILLEHGANPNIRDDYYLTPLEIARMRNDAKTSKIIEEYCKQR